jgi:hypothetical protein
MAHYAAAHLDEYWTVFLHIGIPSATVTPLAPAALKVQANGKEQERKRS